MDRGKYTERQRDTRPLPFLLEPIKMGKVPAYGVDLFTLRFAAEFVADDVSLPLTTISRQRSRRAILALRPR